MTPARDPYSFENTLGRLSGSSQKALSKLSGNDFSEPAGSRVGPLPPALRRTRRLPRGVEYVRTQDHGRMRKHGSSQETLSKLSGSSLEAVRKLSGSSQEALKKLSGSSQENLRKLSGSFQEAPQEALRNLSGSSQGALRKLSGSSEETL